VLLYKSFVIRAAALLAAANLLVLGCGGDDEIGKRYPVSGTVTYNGKPVEKAQVTFQPVKAELRAASGTVQDGKYTLSTAGNNDGAMPGSYQVTVVAKEVDPAKLKSTNPMLPPQALAKKANLAAKSLLPTKYSSPGTSGLTAEVKEQPNTFDFDLKD
jgi:hypothetical protein